MQSGSNYRRKLGDVMGTNFPFWMDISAWFPLTKLNSDKFSDSAFQVKAVKFV